MLAATAVGVSLPASATAPGANGRIGFERPNADGANLFSVAPDGSLTERLTRTPGLESDLSWSPDGSKFAFVRAATERSAVEVYRANADGSGVQRLTRHRRFSGGPTWSPDGTKIAYTTDKDSPEPRSENARPPLIQLYVMDADGTNHRRLVRSRMDNVDPVWSPDGTKIVFSLLRPTGPRTLDGSVAVVSATGGRPRRLTPKGGRG